MDNQSLIQLGIRKRNEDKLLGIISLTNIDYINRKSEISLVIGEPEGKVIMTATEASMQNIVIIGAGVVRLSYVYNLMKNGESLKNYAVLIPPKKNIISY